VIHARSVIDFARAATSELIHYATGGHRLTDETTPRCHLGRRPHPPAPGLHVCDNHLDELAQTLRRIEDETIDLSSRPTVAITYGSGGGGAPAFERSPARLDVIATRDPRAGDVRWDARRGVGMDLDGTLSVLQTLHRWANRVRAARHLSKPHTVVVLDRAPGRQAHGPVCDRLCGHGSCGPWITDTIPALPGVTGERDLLSRNLTWIAQQPWVADLHHDLVGLLKQLQRANGTHEAPVGTCGTLQSDGALCDGAVWHIVIKPDGKIARPQQTFVGPNDEPGFRCAGCRRVWTGTDAVRKRNDMWIEEQTRKAD